MLILIDHQLEFPSTYWSNNEPCRRCPDFLFPKNSDPFPPPVSEDMLVLGRVQPFKFDAGDSKMGQV